jgi:hypothetical protein
MEGRAPSCVGAGSQAAAMRAFPKSRLICNSWCIQPAHFEPDLDHEYIDAQAAADGPLATYGFTILRGSTMRSNSASVTKPSFNAAALSVRSWSTA